MKLLLVEDDRRPPAYLKRALSRPATRSTDAAAGRDGLMLAAGRDLRRDHPRPHAAGDRRPGDPAHHPRRRACKTPVLLLTALGGIDDRVEGLEAGGDDYLVKPFAFAELLARVNALARRPPPQDVQTELQRRRPGDGPAEAAPSPAAGGASSCSRASSSCWNT